MKKEYKKPEIEVVQLEVEDIITDSGTEVRGFSKFLNPNGEADQTWNWNQN